MELRGQKEALRVRFPHSPFNSIRHCSLGSVFFDEVKSDERNRNQILGYF